MEEPDSNIPNNKEEPLDFDRIKREREQYFDQLQTWLFNARLWQSIVAGFPYCYAGSNRNDGQQNQGSPFLQAHLWHQNVLQNLVQQRPIGNGGPVPFYQTYPFTVPTVNVAQQPTTYEFIVPPLWKRLIAEFVDFMILFVVKLALTFVLMESFNFINIDFYSLNSLQKNMDNPDVGFPMAVELLTLELLHRLVVCAYETYFLRGQFCATPGKRYMGLMVITIDNLSLVPNRRAETILVTGAKPLGWQKSLARASLKNLFVGLLLPICITFYIFPQNRTSYDMMANSLVVETHPEFLMYNAAA